jgi:hypothetical protein
MRMRGLLRTFVPYGVSPNRTRCHCARVMSDPVEKNDVRLCLNPLIGRSNAGQPTCTGRTFHQEPVFIYILIQRRQVARRGLSQSPMSSYVNPFPAPVPVTRPRASRSPPTQCHQREQ